MVKISRAFALAFILIMAISSLTLLMVKPAFAQWPIFPIPTPETQNFIYVVSNYTVNYSIIKQTPSAGGNYTGYNLDVYENYPPFPIEISFYDGVQKVTGIALTTSYSNSFVSTNYPTQITMTEVSNETTPTPPTSNSPNPTPTPASPNPNSSETPQQPSTQVATLFGLDWEQIAIILLGITVAVLAFTLVFSRIRSVKQSVSARTSA